MWRTFASDSWGDSVPRFYFHLVLDDDEIPDESGKELATLNEAYEHARKLINGILFHVGHDGANSWKVVISNDHYDAQMIVPFAGSHAFRTLRRRIAPR